jgi:hypothetical protein
LTIYWANCGFSVPLSPTDWNSFFAGCFSGAISDPAGGSKLILVLEAPGPPDSLTLTGCVLVGIGPTTLATLAGSVQDVREEAVLTAMPTSGRPSFVVKVVRDPAGALIATSVDVSDQQGAPFVSANDLVRCDPVQTCESLGISLPFMPSGGMP